MVWLGNHSSKGYSHVIKTYKKHEKSKNKFNRLMTNQLMNVILTIDKVHTAPQRALNCGPGLWQQCSPGSIDGADITTCIWGHLLKTIHMKYVWFESKWLFLTITKLIDMSQNEYFMVALKHEQTFFILCRFLKDYSKKTFWCTSVNDNCFLNF